MSPNELLLVEGAKLVTGLAPILPSTSTSDIVSMKNYDRLAIIIIGDNATTVTGSAITLSQCTDVAAGGAKTLAFTKQWANIDTAASDTLVETAVVSNTFTTTAVNDKNYLHVIELKASDLDVAGGFDCVRVNAATGVATVLSIIFVLYNSRYKKATPPSAIID